LNGITGTKLTKTLPIQGRNIIAIKSVGTMGLKFIVICLLESFST
jgi:hypothetical protein